MTSPNDPAGADQAGRRPPPRPVAETASHPPTAAPPRPLPPRPPEPAHVAAPARPGEPARPAAGVRDGGGRAQEAPGRPLEGAVPVGVRRPLTGAQATTEADTSRSESSPSDVYASELPDLSAAAARTTRGAGGPRVKVSNRPRGPVRASMQVRRIDPWSALKVSLLLSVVLFFVWMLAVAFLYLVLGSMGVWSKLNSNVGDLLDSAGGGTELVSAGSIFGGAILIGLVNIVLLTAMATLGTVIYNLSTDVVGGIEVTLADRD